MNKFSLSHLLAAVATAVATLVVVIIADLPGPGWAWIALSVLYVIVEVRAHKRPGPGWMVALAMAAALDAGGAVVVITTTAIVTGLRDSGQWRRMTARIAAHVLPVAVYAVTIASLPADAVSSVVIAGIVGGATARSIAAAIDWLVRGRTTHPAGNYPLAAEVAESAALGLGAALLGHTLSVAGGLAGPIVIAGLLILMAAEVARLEVVRARVVGVRSLLMALEAKDLYTRGHSERVANYARMTAKEMGLTSARIDRLELAALLHDIGKVVAPRHLLRKKGRLTAAEYCRIQQHADVVPQLLVGIRYLEPIVPIVAEHHVHFDGTGYGLVDGEISMEARILAVADSFDAITTHRPYRAALSRAYAFAELRRCSGTQFDPDVVAAFIGAVGELPAASVSRLESDEQARKVAGRVLIHAR